MTDCNFSNVISQGQTRDMSAADDEVRANFVPGCPQA